MGDIGSQKEANFLRHSVKFGIPLEISEVLGKCRDQGDWGKYWGIRGVLSTIWGWCWGVDRGYRVLLGLRN